MILLAGLAPVGDRLTIRRLLILTAGVAGGLSVFSPVKSPPFDWPSSVEEWLGVANAMLIGLALPAPLFTIRFRRGDRPPLGPGGMFALTAGFGALLMLPPCLVGRIASEKTMAPMCMYYVLPLVGLWYLLAAAAGGQIGRKLLSPDTPWSERYGFLLALLWSPLGVWHLVGFYHDAF